jgi:hypothetical protein
MVPSAETGSASVPASTDEGGGTVSVVSVVGTDDDDADTCGRSGVPQDASVRVNNVADQASRARPRGMFSR